MNNIDGKLCELCNKNQADGKQISTGKYICIDCLYADENNKDDYSSEEEIELYKKSIKNEDEIEDDFGKENAKILKDEVEKMDLEEKPKSDVITEWDKPDIKEDVIEVESIDKQLDDDKKERTEEKIVNEIKNTEDDIKKIEKEVEKGIIYVEESSTFTKEQYDKLKPTKNKKEPPEERPKISDLF